MNDNDVNDKTQNAEAAPPPGDPPSPAPAARPRRRRRWVLPVLFLVTLLAGLIAGASLTVITIRYHVQQAMLYPEERLHKIAARLQKKLDLTDKQTAQVRDIFFERNDALQAIRREVHPRVVEEMDRMYQDVAAILDENQSRKWKRMYYLLRRNVPPPLPATQ